MKKYCNNVVTVAVFTRITFTLLWICISSSCLTQAAETTEAAPAEEAAPAAEQAQEEEEVDIDLNDPKVQDATVKIQAGFKVRGLNHSTFREMHHPIHHFTKPLL